MASDVLQKVTVELSDSRIAHATAKSVDLNLEFDSYVDMLLAIGEQLPTDLLFCLSTRSPCCSM